MEKLNMSYNSQLEKIVIPEYGRNVQNLVAHAKTIKDFNERQLFAERVVELMLQMNPQSKNVMEYREKLWSHFFAIADYDINVVPPSGKLPTPEEAQAAPEKVSYPGKLKEFRHYGNYVRALIAKAIAMEDPEKKHEFVLLIGSFMKLVYKNWNKEHYVSDEIIKEDLSRISENKLTIPEGVNLDFLSSAAKTRKKSYSNNKGRSNNHKGRSNNKNNNNRRRRY